MHRLLPNNVRVIEIKLKQISETRPFRVDDKLFYFSRRTVREIKH